MIPTLAAGCLLLLGALLLGFGLLLLTDSFAPPEGACGDAGLGALLSACPDVARVGGWLSSILGSVAFFAGLALVLRQHARRHPEEWSQWDEGRR